MSIKILNIKRYKLCFVINGVDTVIFADAKLTLKAAAEKALKCVELYLSRPIEDWQVRDVNGVLLENARMLKEFSFEATGARLFLSLAVGAGGCQGVTFRDIHDTTDAQWNKIQV